VKYIGVANGWHAVKMLVLVQYSNETHLNNICSLGKSGKILKAALELTCIYWGGLFDSS